MQQFANTLRLHSKLLTFVIAKLLHTDKLTHTEEKVTFIKSSRRAHQDLSVPTKMTSDTRITMEEKAENILQEFEMKRESLNQALYSLREELKADIDQLFEEMVRIMGPIIGETDKYVEENVKELRRLIQRKKEINEIRRKLSPLIEGLQRGD